MKPHEILQKIIDGSGRCNWDWISSGDTCERCPLGGSGSCMDFVSKRTINGNPSDDDFLRVAKKILADLEVDRVLLGDEIER